MKTTLIQHGQAQSSFLPHYLRNTLFASILACTPWLADAVTLADAPLFSTVVVPGNLALAVSAEFPTALSPAYPNTSTYSSATSYIGYFDPGKCYQYIYNSTTPSDSYFTPTSVTSTHTCTSTAATPLWSGNYLNWATMGALDTFRSVLTGGYRAVDYPDSTNATPTTILEKSYNFNSGAIQPVNTVDKNLNSGVSGATPFTWGSATTKVWHQGNAMLITETRTRTNDGTTCVSGSKCVNIGSPASPYYPITPDGINYIYYNAQSSAGSTANSGKAYKVYIRVKVCDSTVGVEPNCVQYGSHYKPEGLMQKYSSKLRFSTFGYLNIPDYTAANQTTIDGGVLRAKMKFIGPTKPVPGSTPIANTDGIEWSATTGVMAKNPNAADATATNTALGTATITNSGVMNYLNKFGSLTTKDYKTYDPVSELYYAALRYLKNQGNVPAYTNSATATNADGFPVITAWDDPILYSCQQNFIIGIGDVNTAPDGNLPGSTQLSNEPTMPSQVSGDTTVNVTTALARVIALEGSGTASGTNKRNFIAGLAWDAHINDIRSDLTGSQTVNTYWLDVWEYQTYVSRNQYWLAAKYGGFKVPSLFNPATDPIPTSTWYTSSDTVGSDSRPDNYFGAGQADSMKNGLEAAFKKIASEASTATATAISSPTPRQALSDNANYRVTYDPNNWTSTLLGQLVSYNATTGAPTYSQVWDATALLDARTSANRIIVTCCTSTGVALPFTNTSLSSASLDPRTNYASFAAITGVSTGSQSQTDYLEYLRGSRANEISSSGGKYRTRAHLLGDVVDAKLSVVGKPSFPYFDLYNPGYGTFKATYIGRPTVVYVASNDGMLHAFDGTVPSTASGTCTSTLLTPTNACGKELFAYIPSFAYGTPTSVASDSGLASLGTPNSFDHHYLVNATPVSADVDFFKTVSPTATVNDWRTILVGGLGKGGKGYYAIDVTNPASWTTETTVASKVLWEFTHAHMGYSFGDAIFIKTEEFGWTIVVASGYNNDDGIGYFFFINPRTGALLKTVATSTGSAASPINMAHIQAYVPDYKDGVADALYAGDLQGNIWRVDLTPTITQTTAASTTTTTYDYSIVKLATLTDSAGTAQAVTTKPLVEIDPSSGKRYVLVGTGQLLDDSDISSTQKQAFYAINDGTKAYGKFYNGTISVTVGASTSTYSGVAFPVWDNDSSASTPDVPVVLPVTRSYLENNSSLLTGIPSAVTKPMGWYFDLGPSGTGIISERVDIQPTATSDGIVAFAANLPNGNACSPAGTSRAFAVGIANGQSALLDSSGNPIDSVSLTSSITDMSFMSIGGKTGLYAGDSSGTVTKIGKDFKGLTGYMRLNWREVPTAD